MIRLNHTTPSDPYWTPDHIQKWTRPDHYFGTTWPDYYAFLGRHRDSDALSLSNFYTALDALGGVSSTIQIVCERHWAVGWVKWIAIHQDDRRALAIADELQAKLNAYPVLDEEDYTNRETEEADDVWRSCYQPLDRIAYVRKHRDQFEFSDWRDMRSCIKGEYFAGYASDLLN